MLGCDGILVDPRLGLCINHGSVMNAEPGPMAWSFWLVCPGGCMFGALRGLALPPMLPMTAVSVA